MQTYWPSFYPEKSRLANLLRSTLKASHPQTLFYEGTETISFTFKAHPTIYKRLPTLLRPHPDGEAVLFFAQHVKSIFCPSYLEAGLLLKVRSLFGTGYHFLWAVVTNQTAMILGRETLGVPKMMASMRWQCDRERFGLALGDTDRRSLQVGGRVGSEIGEPAKVFGQRFYSVGGVGSFFLAQPMYTYKAREVVLESREIVLDSWDAPSDSPLSRVMSRSSAPTSGCYTKSHIYSSPVLIPCGLAGPSWFLKNYDLRYQDILNP